MPVALLGCSPSSKAEPGPRGGGGNSPVAAGDTGPRGGGGNVLVGAGDIARCDDDGDDATARLLDGIDGRVFTLGDNVYHSGTNSEYDGCYEPTWGRHKARTSPAAGNHDYGTLGASGYFDYFGEAAGDPGEGYYSYDFGGWHVVVLNSNCSDAGGCRGGSSQVDWLRVDLESHSSDCTLAYFHHSRFSSGSEHGSDRSVGAFWKALYKAGADVVLSGHDHDYERFAPQSPDGEADPARGIREFVVGTGGGKLRPFGEIEDNSEVRIADTFGVLKLTLHPESYDWEFVPGEGKEGTDSGSDECH